MQQESISYDLKLNSKTQQQLIRDDYIYYDGSIWRCMSKPMLAFKNTQTKEIKNLKPKLFHTLEKLELIPDKWEVSPKGQIILKGRELGMGPKHEVQVVGMKQFEQLEVVKRDKEMGKNTDYKVVLCSTKQGKKLVISIDIL